MLKQGPRTNRRVVVLAGLILSLLAASPAEAARTEYFGISQAREPDNRDLQGMAAARVRTSRFLLYWRAVQPSQGVWNWRQTDRSSAALPCAESGRCHSCGDPRSGCARALRAPRSTARLPRIVAKLPQGGGGALRTHRQLLDHRLPAAVRGERHAAADPVLADLERAQSPRNTSTPGKRPGMGSNSTPSWCGSHTPRSRAGIRKPRSSLAECSATDTPWPWTSSSPQSAIGDGRDEPHSRARSLDTS